ncbi:hypothetical protein AB0395_32730 [Streptosporangium sp. NPDC051023]|uniref:hypothetical protein n=1 Tax=Streptosporangium sp. NPDC051023 TaxID=3155410 RepID=UPI00344DFA49
MLVRPLELRWEAPPPVLRTYTLGPKVDWAGVAAGLKRRRREWAIVTTCPDQALASQTAWRIRQGVIGTLAMHGEFEAAARTVGGEHRVYARYMGGEL